MEIKTLGTVATYVNGKAFKPVEWERDGLPIIRIQNLTDCNAKYNYSSAQHDECFRVKNGDLLFAWSASLGAHIWHGGDAWLNQHIFRVIPNQYIDKMYLYYYLCSVIAELYSKTHGSGMVHITKAPFMATPIPVPSLSEQVHIVARIEELFSELDSGVETLKTVKAQLEVYRQAVLQKAFNGDLTNSKWLKFDALGSYIEKPRYGTSKKCSYSRDKNSTAVYRIPNIDYEIGGIDHSDIKYATFTDAELQELQLENEDILIIRSNGSVSLVGRAAMIEKADIDGTFAGYLMRLRIKDKSVLCPQFLLLYLQSHKARTYIESKAKSTSGVNNINSGEICALPIPLFKYDEQQKIIESIEARLSVCNNIKKVVNTALQQAEAMRQSILKDTFEGSLQ